MEKNMLASERSKRSGKLVQGLPALIQRPTTGSAGVGGPHINNVIFSPKHLSSSPQLPVTQHFVFTAAGAVVD